MLPAVTDCLHLRAVLHAFKAPALAFLLLCPRPRVAQFQGAGTGCQTATAPRLAAHYTPLPQEVSRQGRGLCSVGQYEGEVGSTLALLSQTSLQVTALKEDYLKLVFPKTQSSGTLPYNFLVILGNNSVVFHANTAPKSLVLDPNRTF